jgi:hypothetical protein
VTITDRLLDSSAHELAQSLRSLETYRAGSGAAAYSQCPVGTGWGATFWQIKRRGGLRLVMMAYDGLS